MIQIDERLKNLKCDVCKNQATRWYGDTSACICENKKCFIKLDESYKSSLAEDCDRFDDTQFEENGGMPYGTYGGY